MIAIEQEIYDSIADSSEDIILTIDLKCRILTINQTGKEYFRKILGKDVRIGENVLSYVPEDLGEKWQNRYNTAFSGEKRVYTDQRDEGKVVYHSRVTISPLLINKEIAGAIVLSKDVTDERINPSLIPEITEINPNSIIMLSCPCIITYSNRKSREQMIRWGEKDIYHPYPLLPPRFKERYCDQCDRITGRDETFDNRDRVFDFKMRPIPQANRCICYINDVTDTMKMQHERNVYLLALENSNNAIVITDKKGNIEYSNDAFSNFYGYSRHEVKGKNPRIINPGRHEYWQMGISEKEYKRLFQEMWDKITTIGQWSGEVLNRTKEGKVKWIHLDITRIPSFFSKEEKFLALSTDIGVLKKREVEIRLEILETITSIGELRDVETGQHMKRVGLYSRLLAEKMGQPRVYCEDIERFSPFHDIGKVGIPDRILLAKRSLTAPEFNTIKEHTLLGYSILKNKPSLKMAAEIAVGHHEKFDGSGYPENLKREQIPLSARITALADVYDALRSRRPYKEPWDHDRTCAELQKLSGNHLDPDVVKTFIEIEYEFLDIYDQYNEN